ncbi:hypothetical protein HAX54_039530, partial [Datura stramonium]|nr:hypothetical protein [Datura stramonium]
NPPDNFDMFEVSNFSTKHSDVAEDVSHIVLDYTPPATDVIQITEHPSHGYTDTPHRPVRVFKPPTWLKDYVTKDYTPKPVIRPS